MMDKKMLEFWGNTLLNAARGQDRLEEMNKMMGQNTALDNPFLQLFFKPFNWPGQDKMITGDIVDSIWKMSAAYKDILKSYLTLFDVVPKEEYRDLIRENEELKARIVKFEKIINRDDNESGRDAFGQEHLIDNLTQIMENQTQQFQELMKQLNQPYKKAATAKKK